MATVGQIGPVKLICGMISADTKLFAQVREQLLDVHLESLYLRSLAINVQVFSNQFDIDHG